MKKPIPLSLRPAMTQRSKLMLQIMSLENAGLQIAISRFTKMF